jgi:tetratricopeptide (TPR) repeat protein
MMRSIFLLVGLAALIQAILLSSISEASATTQQLCVDNGRGPRLLIGPMVDMTEVRSDEPAENAPSSDGPAKNTTKNISDEIALAVFDVLSLDERLSVASVQGLSDDQDKSVKLGRIREAILDGTDSTGRSLMTRKALFSNLADSNCEYLVGWTRSVGNITVVRTFIFDLRSDSVLAPFQSLHFSAREGSKSVGKELGIRLDAFIKAQIRSNRAPRVTFFVGCFLSQKSNQNSDNQSTTRGQNVLRDAVAQVLTEISTNPKYNQLVTPKLCSGSGPDHQSRGDIWLGGEIQVGEKGLTFRPSVNLDFGLVQIRLESWSYPWPKVSDVNARLLDEAKSAILVFSDVWNWDEVAGGVTGKDLVAGKDLADRVADIESAFGRKDVKSAMVKAFLLIGSQSDVTSATADADATSAVGRYELGKGFVDMKEFSRASAELLQALENDGAKLPANLRAAAYEKLGQAYAESNDTDRAIANYQIALGYYAAQNKKDDQSRVRKLMSDARLTSGDYNRAAFNLDNSPDKHISAETQYKLAKVEERQGNLEAAIQSYREALSLDKESDVTNATKRGLARVLGAAGEAAFLKADMKTAEADLTESLKYENNVHNQYLYGVVASKLNEPEAAISAYTIVLQTQGEVPFQFIESSWLNLIEQEILAKRYSDAIASADKAIGTALAEVQDSRLLARYLRFVAVAVGSPDEKIEPLSSSDAYGSLEADNESFRKDSPGGLSLSWDNTSLKKYYSETIKNPDRKQFVDTVTQSIFSQ